LRQGDLKESEKHFENVLLLLASYGPEEAVPESEGMSARRLREIVMLQRNRETPKSDMYSGRTQITNVSKQIVR
jgi:hypothetical protein